MDIEGTYEDLLVTDIERIKRAKGILKNDMADRKEKQAAIGLIKIYQEIGNFFKDSKDENERERAEEILFELNH